MERQLILKCLRDKRTHRILNVSYTEEGLKETYNKVGKSLYDLNKNYVTDYTKEDFNKVKNTKLKKSLEQSENYYSFKALILSK